MTEKILTDENGEKYFISLSGEKYTQCPDCFGWKPAKFKRCFDCLIKFKDREKLKQQQ